MDVDIQSSVIYFGLEKSLAEKLRTLAHDQGETPEDLLSRLVEEHVGSSK
ncbi:MAG TPA: hypothetical protein VGQ36_07295 [Thermoanaerobaculia bacterium]|nr:hypothetical protein [Thermoanaerobaculia bacterium]